MSKDEQTTSDNSLERFLREERTAAVQLFRVLLDEVVKPLIPALVRKMDADTEFTQARAKEMSRKWDKI